MRSLWLFLLAAFVFSASVVDAQSPSDALVIRGSVVDAMGAPIPGAQVTAAVGADTAAASATSDQRGAFTLPVRAGQYTVRVHADGFRDVERRIAAAPSTVAPTEFMLQVAGVREAVTVTAPGGYQVPAITTRDQDTDAAARRAPVGDGRHQRAHQRPDDDEHGRRHALRPGRHASTRARTIATRSSSAATARRPTSSSMAYATTCSTTAISTTSNGSRL